MSDSEYLIFRRESNRTEQAARLEDLSALRGISRVDERAGQEVATTIPYRPGAAPTGTPPDEGGTTDTGGVAAQQQGGQGGTPQPAQQGVEQPPPPSFGTIEPIEASWVDKVSGFFRWNRMKYAYNQQRGGLSMDVMRAISDRVPEIDPSTGDYLTIEEKRDRRIRFQQMQLARGDYYNEYTNTYAEQESDSFADSMADVVGFIAGEMTDPLAIITGLGSSARTLGARVLEVAPRTGGYELASATAEQIAEEGEIHDPLEIGIRTVAGAAIGPALNEVFRVAGHAVDRLLQIRGRGDAITEQVDKAVDDVLDTAEEAGRRVGMAEDEVDHVVMDHMAGGQTTSRAQAYSDDAFAAAMDDGPYFNPNEVGAETVEELAESITQFQNWSGDLDWRYDVLRIASQDETVANFNLGNFATTDDIKTTITTLTRHVNVQPDPKPWADTQSGGAKLANLLGVEKDRLRETYQRLGRLDEEVEATRVLLVTATRNVNEMARRYSPDMSVGEKAEFLKMVEEYVDLSQYASGILSAPGRALNSMRIKTSINEGLASRIRESVNNFGEGRVDELAKAMAMATDAETADRIARASILNKFWSSATELWVNGILSGIKTLTVNMTGNALFTLWQVPERAIAGVIGGTARAGGRSGGSGVYAGESAALMYGMLEGIGDALRAGSYAARTGRPGVGNTVKYELDRPRAISSENLEISGMMGRFVDVIGAAIRTPTKIMLVQDEFFKSMGRNMEMNALAYRQAASENLGPLDMARRIRELKMDDEFIAANREGVDEFAHYITFQSELNELGTKIQQMAHQPLTTLQVPVGRFIVPFIRTPLNIFRAGVLERNPVFALLSTKMREDFMAGGTRRDLALAKVSTGTAIGMYAWYQAAQGNITGAGPANPDQRGAWMQTGRLPYSMRVQTGEDAEGNPTYEWRQYSRLEPLSFLMGAFADAHDFMKYSDQNDPTRETEINNYLSMVIAALAENTMNKTMLTGVSDFFNLMDDPARYSDIWIQRYGSSIIPNAFRDVARVNDPYMREIESVGDALRAKIPNLSKDLPPSRDVWGRPRHHDEGWLVGMRGYGLPISVRPESMEAIDTEIYRLAVEGVRNPSTGETQVFRDALTSMPSRDIRGVRLDEWEYDRLVSLAGQGIELGVFDSEQTMNQLDAMNHLVSRDWYKALPDPAKAEYIGRLHDMYNQAARDYVLTSGEFPELQERVINLREYRQDYLNQAREVQQ